MTVDHLVVVGASLAGIRAVESARKAGHTGRITLVGAEEHLPGLDPKARSMAVGDTEIGYDALVVTTGGTARRLPGSDGVGGVHTLRTWDDAVAVRAALDAGAATVVIGAGFIGSEVASAARKRDLPATVIESLPVPLVRSVGEDMGHACADLHRAHGTDLLCGATVGSLEQAAGRVTGVRTADGTLVPADLVVVGIGVDPSTGWLEGSGLELHERDRGVVADATLRAADGVYAAGDVVHFPNSLFDGEMMRLEHWTTAAEQGALAARNALGPGGAKELGTVPYFWSDWYGSRIQFVGRPQADEIRVVSAETGDPRFLALYRRADRLVGTITIDRPTQIMKYKRLIATRASWADALEFAGVG